MTGKNIRKLVLAALLAALTAVATMIIRIPTLYHRMAGKGMNTITRVVLCGIPAEIIMVLGYFVYEVGMEVVMGSSMGAAAAAVVLGVPMNIVQGIAGIIVGAVLLPVLSHASAEMGEKIRA